ncbi:Ddx49-A-prov protein-like protein [Blastocladiella britannica]|nr:Ddx49-A-prov protein-like protein [Blastocladiella britannica]
MTTAATPTFKDLGIDRWLVDILASLAISSPSDIQTACIPPILAGKNVVGNAKTGSGKTAAFALPIVQSLARDMYGPYALVLTPTRELAFQIAEQFRALGSGINLREAVVVGGMDMMAQALALQKRPHVVIGTPGRLVDHLNSGTALHLRKIKFLVLDEADRLLHPTFSDDLERLFGELPSTRQTLLFSATMTKSIESLIGDATTDGALQNVFVHRSSEKYEANEQLDQRYLFMPGSVKEAFLVYLMRSDFKDKSVIIFTNKCRTCALVLALLQNFGIRATALHSFMTQTERVASLAKFKSNVVDILLATDVGSRGLDIPKVELVINFDVPASATDYIHRVGRTARAGRGGMAVSMASEHDVDVVLNIEKKLGKKLEKYDVDDEEINQMDFLNEVNVAKREALLHLEDTGFGTKKEINMKKQHQLDVEDTKAEAVDGDADSDEEAASPPSPPAVAAPVASKKRKALDAVVEPPRAVVEEQRPAPAKRARTSAKSRTK